jgi:hypothetical protein
MGAASRAIELGLSRAALFDSIAGAAAAVAITKTRLRSDAQGATTSEAHRRLAAAWGTVTTVPQVLDITRALAYEAVASCQI